MRSATFHAATALLLLGTSPTAFAESGPPLRAYIESALQKNPNRGVSRANALSAKADKVEAGGTLLPSVRVQAGFTRNQYAATVDLQNEDGTTREIVVSPLNQVELNLVAKVPLIDTPGYARLKAASWRNDAADSNDVANQNDVALSTARDYYSAVAASETVLAVAEAHAAAVENARIVKARFAEGVASPLVVDRAELEVTRTQMQVATAKRNWAVAQRVLAAGTGMPEPESLSAPPPPVEVTELENEAAGQGATLNGESKRPELAAAFSQMNEATWLKRSAGYSYLPSLYATGTQRFSNTPGFTGFANYWAVGLVLEWAILDFGVKRGGVLRQRAAVERNAAQLYKTQRAMSDELLNARLDVETARTKVVLSRRGVEVAKRAADDSKVRYKAGTATQLDVIQADRDALQAKVDAIQAEGELSVALLVLRRAMGLGVVEGV